MKRILFLFLILILVSVSVSAEEVESFDCISNDYCQWLRNEIYSNDPYTPYNDCLIADNTLYCYYDSPAQQESEQPVFKIDGEQSFNSCPSPVPSPYEYCNFWTSKDDCRGYPVSKPRIFSRILLSSVNTNEGWKFIYNPDVNTFKLRCDGDRFYLYDNLQTNWDAIDGGGSENGLTGYVDILDANKDIEFNPNSYGLIQPMFVCWDYSSDGRDWTWTWGGISTQKIYPSRIQCKLNSDCLLSQECYVENELNTQCQELVCGDNEVIREHKCVQIEIPNLCVDADITDISECGVYLVKYFDVLSGSLNEKEAQILKLQQDIDIKIQLVKDLQGNLEAQADKILLLSNSLEERVEIINNLNLNLAEQGTLISHLTNKVSEQSDYIEALTLNINEQVQIIANLELKRNQQAELILDLTDNINEQAEYINQLATNLAQKEQFVNQLEAENEIQADLIKQMKLSFTKQGEIIDSLNLEISDDAKIIRNLNLNLEEQGQIIAGMKLNLAEQVKLINELTAKVNEQGQIIAGMKLNLQEQIDIINALTDKVDEQIEMINELNLKLADEVELVNGLQKDLIEAQDMVKRLQDMTKQSDKNNAIFIAIGFALVMIIIYLVIKRKK